MAFNTPIFLFLFLPVFLLVYFVSGNSHRNLVLLVFSLVFFAWGDPFYFPVILLLTLANFFFYRWMQRKQSEGENRKRILALGVVTNVLLLLFFKLLSTYGETWQSLLVANGFAFPAWLTFLLSFSFHLPLGISFFTFQAISMLLDGFRMAGSESVSFENAANYLLMFPKVIAGPIVRFKVTIEEIRQHTWDWQNVEDGIQRFVIGFAKKTMIADQLALVTDQGIFKQPPSHIPIGVAWLAVISFTLQIYFDFSGYTDMAIGLGRILGFHFLENFDFPYISHSITEFWRRWHISLSTWFRDYVFYPLERRRSQIPFFSQWLNIVIVFLLTGLWHGITLPFIAWGLLQGLAIALERGKFGRWLAQIWKPLQHVYALGLIILGWVIFRSPSLNYAWQLLKVLLGLMPSSRAIPYSVFPPVTNLTWIALILGIIFSVPLPSLVRNFMDKINSRYGVIFIWIRSIVIILLFIAGIIVQAGTNYHPFIYGEF
jgi:alginate O-acetyltransferase complex protein AlgI